MAFYSLKLLPKRGSDLILLAILEFDFENISNLIPSPPFPFLRIGAASFYPLHVLLYEE